MSNDIPQVTVHVNIDLSAISIQAVVSNSKKKAGKDEKGRYRVDTADALSELISKFLKEKNFEAFAENENNY